MENDNVIRNTRTLNDIASKTAHRAQEIQLESGMLLIKDARNIAKILRLRNSKLKKLYLHGTRITHKALQVILYALKHNRSLEEITVACDKLSCDDLKEVCEMWQKDEVESEKEAEKQLEKEDKGRKKEKGKEEKSSFFEPHRFAW